MTKKEEYHKRSTYRQEYIHSLFDSISHRYDLLNRVLSFGIDRYWRRKAIQILGNFHPKSILDVATGTGDFAIEAVKLSPVNIIGIDISQKMLDIFRSKIRNKDLENIIRIEPGAAEKLHFPGNSFDLVMSSFGVRNFENLESALKEFLRVLNSSGKALILEFSKPNNYFIRLFYRFYSYYILPLIGGIISKNHVAYKYLPKSVANFPNGELFCKLLMEAGFKTAKCHPMTFGIVTIYIATKT